MERGVRREDKEAGLTERTEAKEQGGRINRKDV